MILRTGFGFDVHPLERGRALMLGGVTIPHHKGTKGHSDGDALIHAIVDALLGALSLGDIGDYFPDYDPAFKDMKSRVFLEKAVELVNNQNFSIQNIDTTILLEKPKLKPFIPAIRQKLATIMKMPVDAVSVKSTTEEKLGYIGKEKGVACYAVALLLKKQ